MNASHITLPVALFMAVLATGCGSTKTSSPAGVRQCVPANSTCTTAEYKTYTTCVENACDSVNKECLGAAYKSGTYTGPCGAYTTCTNACACNDTACLAACNLPDASCVSCLLQASTCTSTCTPPICSQTPAGGGGASGAGTGGGTGQTGGTSGQAGSTGSGGATAGGGGAGGGAGGGTACADLLACCTSTTNPTFKMACMSSYTTVMSSGESACAMALTQVKSFCP